MIVCLFACVCVVFSIGVMHMGARGRRIHSAKTTATGSTARYVLTRGDAILPEPEVVYVRICRDEHVHVFGRSRVPRAQLAKLIITQLLAKVYVLQHKGDPKYDSERGAHESTSKDSALRALVDQE